MRSLSSSGIMINEEHILDVVAINVNVINYDCYRSERFIKSDYLVESSQNSEANKHHACVVVATIVLLFLVWH